MGSNVFINAEGAYFIGNTRTSIANTYANSEGFFSGNSEGTVQNSSGFFINGVPAGSNIETAGDNTQVQFNDSGALGASAGLTFDKDSNTLFVGNTLSVTNQVFANQFSGNDVLANTGNFQNVSANNFSGNHVVVVDVTSNQVFVNTISGNTGSGFLNFTSNQVFVNTVTANIVKAAVSVNVGANVHLSPVEMFVGDGAANTTQNSSGFWKDGVLLTSTSPGGTDTQVQFNDGGAFGGTSGFTFTKTTNHVFVANTLTTGNVVANQVFVNTISGNIATGFINITSNGINANTFTGNTGTGFLNFTSNQFFGNTITANIELVAVTVNVGANSYINCGTHFVGNSTVNTVQNATGFYVNGMFCPTMNAVNTSTAPLDTGKIVLEVNNGANLFFQRTMAGHELLQNPNNMPTGATISALIDPTQVSTAARSVVASATGEATQNSTAHTITLPSASNGNMLLVFFSVDNVATVSINSAGSTSGWTLVSQIKGGTATSNQVTAALLYKYATGGDTLVLDTSANEQSTHISLTIDAMVGGDITANNANNAGSTNVNPPNVVPGFGTQNYLYIASAHLNNNIAPTVAPTNYTNLTTKEGNTTNSTATAIAYRQVSASSSEDPGTFTSTSNGWCSYTVAIGATGHFYLSYDTQYVNALPNVTSETLLQIQKIGATRYVAVKSWESLT